MSCNLASNLLNRAPFPIPYLLGGGSFSGFRIPSRALALLNHASTRTRRDLYGGSPLLLNDLPQWKHRKFFNLVGRRLRVHLSGPRFQSPPPGGVTPLINNLPRRVTSLSTWNMQLWEIDFRKFSILIDWVRLTASSGLCGMLFGLWLEILLRYSRQLPYPYCNISANHSTPLSPIKHRTNAQTSRPPN